MQVLMADHDENTLNFDEIMDAVNDLVRELGEELPDTGPALRAVRDAFKAFSPVARAQQLNEHYLNSLVPVETH